MRHPHTRLPVEQHRRNAWRPACTACQRQVAVHKGDDLAKGRLVGCQAIQASIHTPGQRNIAQPSLAGQAPVQRLIALVHFRVRRALAALQQPQRLVGVVDRVALAWLVAHAQDLLRNPRALGGHLWSRGCVALGSFLNDGSRGRRRSSEQGASGRPPNLASELKIDRRMHFAVDYARTSTKPPLCSHTQLQSRPCLCIGIPVQNHSSSRA